MKQILHNLAMLDLLAFCKENNIDCSGTYLIKQPRRFTYELRKNDTEQLTATVTFHKNGVPTHTK